MPAALRSPWAWMPPLVVLTLLAALLGSGANLALFLWLNARGHAVGNLPWMHLTMLGDGAVGLALVLPLIRRAPRLFSALLIAAAVAALWTQLPKQVVDVPRPLGVFAPDAFHQAGPAYRRVSFPSGHAAAAFALAGVGVMGAGAGMLARLLLLALATLVGLSRIMLGVHWPVDVLWGMLGGWLGAWLGLALDARWRWRTTGTGGLLAGLVLIVVTAGLLVSRHIGIPAVLPAQRVIGAVCLVWGGWHWLQIVGLRWRAWPPRLPWPAWLARREQKRGGDG